MATETTDVLRVRLYDADGLDADVRLADVPVGSLGERQLLWIDLGSAERDHVEPVAAALKLPPEAVSLIASPALDPTIRVAQGHFHLVVTAVARTESGYRPVALHCLAGRDWVLTVHREPVPFLDHFTDRILGDSRLGRLTAGDFTAALLDEHVGSYFAELQPFESELDRLDVAVMTRGADEDAVLRQLVALRRRLGKLRRLLTPHREPYALLARPDFAVLVAAGSSESLPAVVERLESAIATLESTREMILGSFDIYTTWTAHGTNKVMKVLTVVSVTLLPPTLLVGIMGMNALPGTFSTTTAFWISIGLVVSLAAVSVAVARLRHWL
jgi:magnesium transporter